MQRLNDNKGYTLMDMVTSIVLGMIVLGMAAPATSKILNQYRLRGAASQIAFELSRARMQAVAQNKFVRVRFTDSGTYVLETSQDGGTYEAAGGTVSLPDGVNLVSDGATSLTFNRQGFVQNNMALSIQNPNGQKTISMNSIGRVTAS